MFRASNSDVGLWTVYVELNAGAREKYRAHQKLISGHYCEVVEYFKTLF